MDINIKNKNPAQMGELKRITLEEIRAKLKELSWNGKQEMVRALIERYGVVRISKIPEEKYAEMMREV